MVMKCDVCGKERDRKDLAVFKPEPEDTDNRLGCYLRCDTMPGKDIRCEKDKQKQLIKIKY